MDQVIWVEILSRRRDVAARYRFEGPEIRIGRAYDNDVVLDDPFVAANHVRLFRSADGELIAEDAGSANGLFLDRDKQRQERIVIDGERPIRIAQRQSQFGRGHLNRSLKLLALASPTADGQMAPSQIASDEISSGAIVIVVTSHPEAWLSDENAGSCEIVEY